MNSRFLVLTICLAKYAFNLFTSSLTEYEYSSASNYQPDLYAYFSLFFVHLEWSIESVQRFGWIAHTEPTSIVSLKNPAFWDSEDENNLRHMNRSLEHHRLKCRWLLVKRRTCYSRIALPVTTFSSWSNTIMFLSALCSQFIYHSNNSDHITVTMGNRFLLTHSDYLVCYFPQN